MKIILQTFIVLFVCVSNAQISNQVKYVRTFNISNTPIKSGFVLKTNPGDGLSSFIFEGILSEADTIVTQIDDLTVNKVIIQRSSNPQKIEIQKDFNHNSLLSLEPVYREKDLFLVEEDLPEIKWVTHNEKKVILGYETQKATTQFRGRDYEVWFTQAIGIYDGPWKLSGLPGLILEVKTKDGFLEFEAYEINLNMEYSVIENLKNKYPKIKILSSDERKKMESKNVESQIKYLKSQSSGETEVLVNTNNIEIGD